jgi:hypothetical protein
VRIIAMQHGGDLKAVFERFSRGITEVCEAVMMKFPCILKRQIDCISDKYVSGFQRNGVQFERMLA